MTNITNPHDKFFRTSFSRLDVVRSFIEEILPKQYRDKINLDSLRLSNYKMYPLVKTVIY